MWKYWAQHLICVSITSWALTSYDLWQRRAIFHPSCVVTRGPRGTSYFVTACLSLRNVWGGQSKLGDVCNLQNAKCRKQRYIINLNLISMHVICGDIFIIICYNRTSTGYLVIAKIKFFSQFHDILQFHFE